ncbi:hypothetical protein [Pseudanabaena mucicola]|uniref:hypothetical protein n=1 Tax=Pseudanabaena mucicola TaxID=71190 RepID=UPI0018EF8744|nr:hypothetical protein [Pseudanabaena mucicola]
MFKSPSSKLLTKVSSLCLALVIMLGVFLGNPINAQANIITSNFDGSIAEMRSQIDGKTVPLLLADAVVENEATAETPEAKAAAKLEAKKAKAAAKLEAKKLKEAAEAEAAEAKAAEKAAKKAAKLEAKKAKEAAKLEAKKAKEAEKAAVIEEEKLSESPEATPSEPAAETAVETETTP